MNCTRGAPASYGQQVKVERHWWNGDRSMLGRRDVYIRSDGEHWEVEAKVGGDTGRSKVHQCPGLQSATILAQAWMNGPNGWQSLVP